MIKSGCCKKRVRVRDESRQYVEVRIIRMNVAVRSDFLYFQYVYVIANVTDTFGSRRTIVFGIL